MYNIHALHYLQYFLISHPQKKQAGLTFLLTEARGFIRKVTV